MAINPMQKPAQTKSDALAHRSAPPRANLTNMRAGMVSPRHYADGTSNVSPWNEAALGGPVAAAGGVPPVSPQAMPGAAPTASAPQGESLLSRTSHAPLDAYHQAADAFHAGNYAEALGAGARGLFASPAAAIAGTIQAAPAVGEAFANDVGGLARGFTGMVAAPKQAPTGTAIGGSGAAPQQSALPHGQPGGSVPAATAAPAPEGWAPANTSVGQTWKGLDSAWNDWEEGRRANAPNPHTDAALYNPATVRVPGEAPARFYEVRPGFVTNQPEAVPVSHQQIMSGAPVPGAPGMITPGPEGWDFQKPNGPLGGSHMPMTLPMLAQAHSLATPFDYHTAAVTQAYHDALKRGDQVGAQQILRIFGGVSQKYFEAPSSQAGGY